MMPTYQQDLRVVNNSMGSLQAPRAMMVGGGGTTMTMCSTIKEEIKRKIISVNDTYDSYVPSFQY
jgi:hypothetical protein